MSGVNAVNSSNINFCGNKDEKETKELRAKKAPKMTGAKVNGEQQGLTAKLTAPIRDNFKKTYDGADATPELVADYVSDNLIKAGVAVAGTALLLAKSRKATNGLSRALKDSFQEIRQASTGGEKTKLFGKMTELVKGTFAKVKANNLDDAKQAAEAAAKTGSKSFKQTVGDALLKPKTFEEGSGLGKFIDKNFGKHSSWVKERLGKVGISNASDLADTAIAGAATAALSGSATGIAGTVTSEDNDKLAHQAKLNKLEDTITALDRLAQTASMIAG